MTETYKKVGEELEETNISIRLRSEVELLEERRGLRKEKEDREAEIERIEQRLDILSDKIKAIRGEEI